MIIDMEHNNRRYGKKVFCIPENMRKYLEKENIFLQRRRRTDAEKEENMWKRKYVEKEKKNREGRGRTNLEKEKLARVGWTDVREAKAL